MQIGRGVPEISIVLDFDGLQPFLFAHITAIRPFLFLVTARIRAVYVPFYVFWESHDYAIPAKTT